MKIIDTHIHQWTPQPGRYAWLQDAPALLQQEYPIHALETQRKEAGVTAGVLVQAENSLEDTQSMLHQAEATPWIQGVVGWLPLSKPHLLADWAAVWQHPHFKGVRHLIHNEPNPRWLLQAPVLESLQWLADRQIPYDVVGITTQHIETALMVADRIPNLTMVFDHCNQPPFDNGQNLGRWGELMDVAANHKNFYMKISGLGTAAGKHFSAEALEPVLQFVFENFGPNRCFTGGDWPVSLLAKNYVDTYSIYKQVINKLLPVEQAEKVFYHNAIQFYKLTNL